MRPYNGHRRGSRPKQRPTTPDELEAALRAYAVKLFDSGDGHAVDWPLVAATAFKVAFSCLDEVKGDERAAKVLRRVEGGVYDRLAGNPDDGTPYVRATPPSRHSSTSRRSIASGRPISIADGVR